MTDHVDLLRARTELRKRSRALTIGFAFIITCLVAILLTLVLTSKQAKCFVGGCKEPVWRRIHVCRDHHQGAYFLDHCDQHKEMWGKHDE